MTRPKKRSFQRFTLNRFAKHVKYPLLDCPIISLKQNQGVLTIEIQAKSPAKIASASRARTETMKKKHLVSAALLKLAADKAEAIMAARPYTREDWLNQCRTSHDSNRDGGVLAFSTDWDWVPAFFIWYHGGGHALTREK